MSLSKFFISGLMAYFVVLGWSVNSWLGLWFLIEVSFMVLLTMFAFDSMYKTSELMIKYFLVQVMAGLWLLMSLLIGVFSLSGLVYWGVILSLMTKLGLAPFHFWVLSILGKLGWVSLFFMLSFSKFLPMLFMIYSGLGSWVGWVVLISAFVGSTAGINNLAVQKIMGYSSMVSACWLLLAGFLGELSFFIYFICYCFMTFVVCYMFCNFNVYYLNQFKVESLDVISKLLIFTFSLVFSGIPPFLGFFMKWWLSWSLVFVGVSNLIFFLVVMSLLVLLFYFQLYFYFMLVNSFSLKWYSLSLNLGYWWVMFYVLLICGSFIWFLV